MVLAMLVAAASALLSASAHPGADARREAADAACDPVAWQRAAHGFLEEGRRREALAAVAQGEGCGLEVAAAARLRAEIATAAFRAGSGPPEDALGAVDAALAASPADRGLALERAHLLAALGRVAEAAAAGDGALDGVARPRPDDALAVAQWWRTAGEPERALARLDDALVRIGPAPALVAAALEIELALGRPIAARGRLDGLPATVTWLDWRGRVAARCGDGAAAADAWAQARESALARPTPAHRRLATELSEALAAWEAVADGITPRR